MGGDGGYLDYSARADRLSGGARRMPIDTSAGRFPVWTKRIGNNPELKMLLPHGGPGATHEYLEACDSYLPGAGIEASCPFPGLLTALTMSVSNRRYP
jgi:proline iminopeptidase